jgi:uncharacterized protein
MMQKPSAHMHRGIALQAAEIQCVCDILQTVLKTSVASASNAPCLEAWVFGSRATGHARPHSDLDILISSPKQLDWLTRADLTDAFEASALPFHVDVVEEAHLSPGLSPRVMAERMRLI